MLSDKSATFALSRRSEGLLLFCGAPITSVKPSAPMPQTYFQSYSFSDFSSLLAALNRESGLIDKLFKSRSTWNFKYSTACEEARNGEDGVRRLIDCGLLCRNGDCVELDPDLIRFLEKKLHARTTIDTSALGSAAEALAENIGYYLLSDGDKERAERQKYLAIVKSQFRDIGFSLLSAISDIKGLIETTYKTEPVFAVKRKKLQNIEKKSDEVKTFTRRLHDDLTVNHTTFLHIAADAELDDLAKSLTVLLSDVRHTLITLDGKIVYYLNLLERQSQFAAKLQHLALLLSRGTIEAETNIADVCARRSPVCWAERPRYLTYLSLPTLRDTDEGHALLVDYAAKRGVKTERAVAAAKPRPARPRRADMTVRVINAERVKNDFLVSDSADDLLHFLLSYTGYTYPASAEERKDLFLRIAITYCHELRITSDMTEWPGHGRYALIYAKR